MTKMISRLFALIFAAALMGACSDDSSSCGSSNSNNNNNTTITCGEGTVQSGTTCVSTTDANAKN
ncbi:MAG TPA: hypothetical protein DCZ01_10800 [Elusimicrobia bacterium]|nr:MAG: hypothetical protein A2X37_00615 [Elusimicrobia bacterium GWA2_66_18]HAZ08980.1 hypothetical protein [Elusimicrobiota bacterium]